MPSTRSQAVHETRSTPEMTSTSQGESVSDVHRARVPEIPSTHSESVSQSSRTQTEWRPISNDDAATLFNHLLNRIQSVTSSVVEEIPKPEYSGLAYENPQEFIDDLEEYLSAKNVSTGRRRVQTALTCLKGDARRRIEPLVTLGLQWDEFPAKILSLFDDDATKRRILVGYLSTAQKTTESAETFIRGKQLLANRVDPRASPAETVSTICELLLPQIRLQLRGTTIETVGKLIEVANLIEEDLRQVNRTTDNRRTYNPPPNTNRSSANATTAPAYHAAHTPQSTFQPDNAGQRELPPCRYCPARHLHRDCPVLRAQRTREREDTSRQPAPVQGNGPQAGIV